MRHEELRRAMPAEQQELQRQRIKVREQAAKRRKRERFLSKLELIWHGSLVIFTLLVVFAWIVSISMLDSGSMVPAVVTVVTTIYLAAMVLITEFLR